MGTFFSDSISGSSQIPWEQIPEIWVATFGGTTDGRNGSEDFESDRKEIEPESWYIFANCEVSLKTAFAILTVLNLGRRVCRTLPFANGTGEQRFERSGGEPTCAGD